MKSNILKLINWIVTDLSQIRKQLECLKPENSTVSLDWVSWKEAMSFFGYKDTQMAEMAVEQQLVVAKVGRRKFIKRSSILELLEKSIASEMEANSGK